MFMPWIGAPICTVVNPFHGCYEQEWTEIPDGSYEVSPTSDTKYTCEGTYIVDLFIYMSDTVRNGSACFA